MNLENLILIIFGLLCFILYWLLRWANFKRPARFRQLWSPIGAIVVTGLGYYYWLKDYHEKLRPDIELIFQALDLTINWMELLLTFVYSLIVVGIFTILKYNVNVGFLGLRKYKTNNWSDLKDIGLSKLPTFVYQLYEGEYIALKRLWEFATQFFYWASIVGGVALVVTILVIDQITFFPPLTVFPILVFLEFYWYFGGEKAQAPKKVEDVIDIPSIKNRVFFYKLWEEYQKEWADKVLVAWHYQGNEQFESPPTADSNKGSFMGLLSNLTQRQQNIYQHLSSGSDLIISNVRYHEVTPVVFTFLLKKILNSEQVLIVTPRLSFDHSAYHQAVLKWLDEGLKELSGNDIFWSAGVYDRTKRGQFEKDIMISSADDLLEHKALKNKWFDEMHTVLFIYTIETLSANPTANNILLKSLKDRNERIQNITLVNYRRGIQDAIKRNFEVNKEFEEVRLLSQEAEETFLLFWKLEDIPFQRRVLQGRIDSYLGAEVPLSLLAWREGVEHIHLVNQQQLPYYEYLEQLDNNKNRLDTAFLPSSKLQGKTQQKISTIEHSLFNHRDENAFLLTRDMNFNLPTCLEEWNSYGEKVSFVHVISPPYLLRTYFADNLKYFKKAPLYALTAYLMNTSRFSVALSLLERMIAEPLTEQQIRFELAKVAFQNGTITDLLRELFLLAFNLDLSKSAWLHVEEKWEYQQAQNDFEGICYYSLNEKIKEQLELEFLRYVKVVDQHNNNIQRILPYDLVYQNYLPGQLHVFQQGRAYEIEELDKNNYWLRTDNQEPKSPIVAYRTDREVVLKELLPPFRSDIDESQEDVYLALREGRFSIKTNGYFSFLNGIKLEQNNRDFTYTNLNNKEIPIRNYQLGRILELRIKHDLKNADNAKLSSSLCVLLKELFYTIFPETHQYLLVTSEESSLDGRFEQLYDTLKIEKAALRNQDQDTLTLYLFEDAHQDLGLLNSIFKEWRYLLEILGDYLYWLDHQPLSKEKDDAYQPLVQGDFRKSNLSARAFLSFGLKLATTQNPSASLYGNLKHFPSFLDLEQTAYLIAAILGENELTIEREQKRSTKKQKQDRPINPSGKHQCDFCAKHYPALDMKVLEDGRERCPICSETAVDDEVALKRVMDAAHQWFKDKGRFDELSKKVKILFVSSEKIQKYRGDRFLPSPQFDPRTLGLAVRKGNKYSIWIENGQPYHHTLAITVHELTHIWQYGNVDYMKMKEEWGLHLIEGHTIWAEIDCLEEKYKQNKDDAYLEFINREKHRTDIYGEGYRLILKFMDDNQDDDAFVYLKKKYPK